MPNLQDPMPTTPAYRRTRLAPTPSGYLHVGNVVSFVLTAGLARRHGASILLRIDDLDRQRMRTEYVQDIFETLAFLEIPWDDGPRDEADFFRSWSQHRRMGIYQEALAHLREGGRAFACGCSRADLARDNVDGAYPGTCIDRRLPLDGGGLCWRLEVLPKAPLRFFGSEGRAGISDLPPDMRHVVIRRKDGLPAYQLASVADDLHFGVDLVVRGADLLPSTLAQLHLAGLLPANPFGRTAFVHHPLLKGPGGDKLSKSAGAESIRYLRRQGLDRAAVFGHISACLGMEEPASDWGGLFEGLSTAGWTGGLT